MFIYLFKRQNPSFGMQKIILAAPIMVLSVRQWSHDSPPCLLNGINYRGLRKDVKICARSGASIDDLWEEISVYYMKSFKDNNLYRGK